MLAGLQDARGEVVITMDADLQHPPGIIPMLCERWRSGYKIVNTIRRRPAKHSVVQEGHFGASLLRLLRSERRAHAVVMKVGFNRTVPG
jgi:glycosyltransferase involved in cell wall biosynthesis